jgi:uncharacterized protein (TIGR00255 family)
MDGSCVFICGYQAVCRMSVKSMTGFARVRRELPEGDLIVSLKTVNHRGLDLHFHMPGALDAFEPAIRTLLKSRVSRGHVQIQISFSGARNGRGNLNYELLEAWLGGFREASEKYGLKCEPDLNEALRIPGVLLSEIACDLDESFETPLKEAVNAAIDELDKFRSREGATIAKEIRERSAKITELAEKMEKIRSKATPAFQKRLKERLAELLKGAGIEPQRLAQEAAIMTERSDVSEELLRLKTHAVQVEDLLNNGGEAGKKLDFLLQEMNREANTVLSKTGGLGELGLTITDLALAAKAEIDKIREQSLNIE